MKITLRQFRDDDFAAFHAIVSEYDVVKMTASFPFPAEQAYTRMRMTTPEAKAGLVNAIDVDGALAGAVGIVNNDAGYLIGKDFWGRGVMTRALNMRIAEEFADPKVERIKACVWHDNPASARVLEKAGFKRTHTCRDFCKARDAEIEAIHFKLSRQDWLARTTT